MIRSTTIRVAGVTVAGLSIAVTKPEIIECYGKGQVKPNEIVLVCGDRNTFVSNIKWKKWNDNKATGTGRLRWNTCLPETCVSGIVQTHKGKITLSGIASAPGETDFFSEMTLTFTQGGPALSDKAVHT